MEYYKYIKLSNGDDIIAKTELAYEDYRAEKYIKIIDPVCLGVTRISSNQVIMETYTMQSWTKLGVCNVMLLSSDMIITVADLLESAVSHYISFVEDRDKKPIQDVSEKSIEEKLSMLLENIEDGDDSQLEFEENEQYNTTTRRIIH